MMVNNTAALTQKEFFFQGTDRVRMVIDEKGEPWFVAKDVCLLLGCGETNIWNWLRKVPEEMKGNNPIITLGGRQRLNCVNEAGLYKLIMRSDKPEAQQFQNWIASEVLPSIRKHGMYMTAEKAQEAIEDPDTFIARALLMAKEKLDKQAKEIAEMKPKAQTFDAYMDYRGSHCFRDVAKVIGMDVHDLITRLASDGVLYQNIKGEWLPRRAYERCKYFRVTIMPHYTQTRVLPAGFQFISEKYGGEVAL